MSPRPMARVRSMTGAATASKDVAGGRLDLEVRSVNHRFLKVGVRVEGRLPRVEPLAEAAAKAHLERGHVSYGLRLASPGGPSLASLDEAAFAEAAATLRRLATMHGLETVSVRDVLQVPGVLRGAGEPDEALEPAIAALLDEGTRALVVSREREGQALAGALGAHLDRIAELVGELTARADAVPEALRARVRERVEVLLEGTGTSLDAGQLEREIAWLADRADVREELARLEAHVGHARDLLSEGGAIGKRLDFLAQELLREVNTVGSKTPDLASTHHVLALKTEVERLREQVQNVE